MSGQTEGLEEIQQFLPEIRVHLPSPAAVDRHKNGVPRARPAQGGLGALHLGIFDPALDPSKEEVYRFLDTFLGEMAALFPDPYLHVGGDEVNGKQWDASERLAAFKKQKGFKDDHELQGYFSQRVEKIVTGHGKKMIGWDEILLPGLPKDSVIQSWRGQESLGAAAKQGYQGILSNGYYIDLMWPADRHYLVDPWDKGVDQLPEADRARILGGEATMWSEFTTAEIVDSRVWPRTALYQRLWRNHRLHHFKNEHYWMGVTMTGGEYKSSASANPAS